jgi:predicted DNA-binding transcriptional regulator AlpA
MTTCAPARSIMVVKMSPQNIPGIRDSEPDDGASELLAKPAVLKLFGGTKPINSATLYRGMAQGRFPRPIKIGPKTSRWLRSECEAKLREIIANRAA